MKKYIKFSLSFLFCIFLFQSSILFADQKRISYEESSDARQIWINGYSMMKEAEKVEQEKNFSNSLDLYKSSLELFEKVRKKHSDWNQALVDFRINYCKKRIKKLSLLVDREKDDYSKEKIIDLYKKMSLVLKKYKKAYKKSKEKNKYLKTALQEARNEAAENTTVHNKMKELMIASKQLQSKINSQQKIIEHLKKEFKKLSENEKNNEKWEILKKKYDATEINKEKIKKLLIKYKYAYNNIKKRMKEISLQKTEIEQKFKRVNEEEIKSQNQKLSLQKRISTQKIEIQDIANKLKQKNTDVEILEKSKENLINKFEAIKKSNDSLNAVSERNLALIENNANLNKELLTAKEKEKHQTKIIADLNKELLKSEEKEKQQILVIANLAKNLKNNKRDLEELKIKLKKMGSVNTIVEKEKYQTQSIVNLKKTFEQKDRDLKIFKEKLRSAITSAEKEQAYTKIVNTQLENYKKELKETKKRLSEINKKNIEIAEETKKRYKKETKVFEDRNSELIEIAKQIPELNKKIEKIEKIEKEKEQIIDEKNRLKKQVTSLDINLEKKELAEKHLRNENTLLVKKNYALRSQLKEQKKLYTTKMKEVANLTDLNAEISEARLIIEKRNLAINKYQDIIDELQKNYKEEVVKNKNTSNSLKECLADLKRIEKNYRTSENLSKYYKEKTEKELKILKKELSKFKEDIQVIEGMKTALKKSEEKINKLNTLLNKEIKRNVLLQDDFDNDKTNLKENRIVLLENKYQTQITQLNSIIKELRQELTNYNKSIKNKEKAFLKEKDKQLAYIKKLKEKIEKDEKTSTTTKYLIHKITRLQNDLNKIQDQYTSLKEKVNLNKRIEKIVPQFLPEREYVNMDFDKKIRIRARMNQAIAAEKNKKMQTAIFNYEKIIESDSQNKTALLRLGNIYIREGNHEEGIKYLKRAFYLSPDDKDILLPLGFALIKEKQEPDLAVSLLLRAVAFNPENSTLHRSLGIGLQSLGWSNAALKQFKRSFDLDSKNINTAFNIAVLYIADAKMNNAKKWYEKAKKLGCEKDPGLEELFYSSEK
ncbi:MAG: hypothetical protein U9O87_04880 [Verrucomicrobiota bacterium]|nr:hypothetical protein [Verrucomicrobiota bacterium]